MSAENDFIFDDSVEETQEQTPEQAQEQDGGYEEQGYSMEGEQAPEEENQYYSLEEMDGLSDADEIDMDRIPPAMQKMFDRMQKQSEKQNIPTFQVSDELSLEQVSAVRQRAINDVAVWLQQQGIEYDENNLNHSQLVSEQQNNLMRRARQEQRQASMAQAIDTDLRGKYGKNFDAINQIALRYVNDEIPAAKQREINQRIRNGDTKLVYQIYEQASKKYYAQNPGSVRKKTVFPPHSISGGTKQNVSKNQKVLKEDYFL